MGILIVPGAWKFSSPIPPPITSNKPPKKIPIPFFKIEKKFPTLFPRLGQTHPHHTKFGEERECEINGTREEYNKAQPRVESGS